MPLKQDTTAVCERIADLAYWGQRVAQGKSALSLEQGAVVTMAEADIVLWSAVSDVKYSLRLCPK